MNPHDLSTPLFTDRHYITTFYLVGTFVIGLMSAVLASAGLPVALVITLGLGLIWPLHLTLSRVYRSGWRHKGAISLGGTATACSSLLTRFGFVPILAAYPAVVGFYLNQFYSETTPITFGLIAFLTTFLLVYAEFVRRAVRGRSLFDSARGISNTLALIHDPWQRQVAREIVDHAERVLKGLARPSFAYHTEEELYAALTKEVDGLRSGETLFAICSDKTWHSPAVRDYLEANFRAAARGVRITRVFYEFSGRILDEARKEANSGIEVKVLRFDKLDSLGPIHRIPADLGIAVFNDRTVFLESGVGAQTSACRYDHHQLAAVIRSQFAPAEEISERVAPTSKASAVRASDRAHSSTG